MFGLRKKLGLRKTLITAAMSLALVAGCTAAGAAIASGPVDGAGVIHGCWTNAAINGTHVFVLQDAGTSCPKGTTAITWNQTGPQGPAGPTGATGPAGPAGAAGPIGATGPAGPAGATGPAGAAGPAGPPGADGSTVLNGTGAPAPSAGNDGDFYIDTAADVLYGPKAGGAWPAGVSLIGSTGPQGPAGPQGPPGSAGSGSVTTFTGFACTTDGGAAGTVTSVTADSTNTVALKCTANTTDANCTHSDGEGDAYTDCNDLVGTPGDAATYNQTMALAAAKAFADQQIASGDGSAAVAGPFNDHAACASSADSGESAVVVTTSTEVYAWIYTASSIVDRSGFVFTEPTSSFNGTLPCIDFLINAGTAPTWT